MDLVCRSIEGEEDMNKREATGEIVSATRIIVRPEKRKELFMTMSSLIDEIRTEDGCRAYRFYGEADNQDSYILIGEWETRSAWNQHLNSEHFAILLGSLRLLTTRANIEFKLLSQVAGIEELNEPEIEH
ncbi:MAG: hypothetical protein C5B44_00575 [Acidobacteria bacterium]|nr:MAG: hypothetical protein C5B44_00575 [Acidobacteriota bacterium]